MTENTIPLDPNAPDDPGDSQQERRIRTGDTVLHRPSGETWVVAYANYNDGELSWCGWPDGLARITDCELIASCDDDQHRKLLSQIAQTSGRRGERARRILADAS